MMDHTVSNPYSNTLTYHACIKLIEPTTHAIDNTPHRIAHTRWTPEAFLLAWSHDMEYAESSGLSGR